MKKGFSLVEMLIVITLLAILAVSGISILTGYQRDSQLSTIAERIVETLRSAQSKSITGQGTYPWSVHFDTSVSNQHFFALFQGTAYGTGTDIDPAYLTDGAQLYSLSLTGGGSDVLFNRLTGATSQYGSGGGNRAVCVTNTLNASTCTKGIVITSNGKISLQ